MADGSPDLEALLELAERPRAHGWSMAAALMRYAQPKPAQVARVWQEVRRVLWSLKADAEALEAEWPALWERAQAERGAAPGPASDQHDLLVAVIRAAMELDALGDVLATWAVDRAGERPDEQVEQVAQEVAELLDAAGVAHEPREGPPRGRGSRRGV